MKLAVFRRVAFHVQDLARDTRGAVLPILALAIIPLVVMVGAGIDYGRAISQREVLANALDVAALNIASQLSSTVMTDGEISEALTAAFEANLSSLSFKDQALENLDFLVDPDEGVVKVSSQISIPSYFIHIGEIGPENITMSVNTEVNYSRFDVELALILDVTGSMGSDPTDIAALRTAAQDLVDTLIPAGTSASDSKVRISVVPYSQGVNLGTYANSVTNGASSSRNCVTERVGDQRYTDAYYSYDGADSEFFRAKATEYYYDGRSQTPSEVCPAQSVVPLTANRTTLEAIISSLTASGGTAGHIGIAWGWYTLSPSWSSLWPGSSRPEAYDDDDILKFAVIMTDGNFNNYYDLVDKTTRTCDWVRVSYYPYWERQCTDTTTQVWTEYYDNSADYNDPSAERGRTYCDAMKDEGIELFTIYFETTGSDFGDEEMEDCANDATNYYPANNRDQLIAAFGNIAKKIQAIYLAK